VRRASGGVRQSGKFVHSARAYRGNIAIRLCPLGVGGQVAPLPRQPERGSIRGEFSNRQNWNRP